MSERRFLVPERQLVDWMQMADQSLSHRVMHEIYEFLQMARAAPEPLPEAWLGHCPNGNKLLTTRVEEAGEWLDRGDVLVVPLCAQPDHAKRKEG